MIFCGEEKRLDVKMKKKIFGIFSKEPLIWLHYVLLTSLVILARVFLNWISNNNDFINLNEPWQILSQLSLWFITYFLIISIGDQLIHKILGVD